MVDPRPYVVGVGASGFSAGAWTSILTNTTDRIELFGSVPAVVMVMGGVNDLAIRAPAATIIAGMEQFESAMTELGSTVVWVAEPAWDYFSDMAPLTAWILAQPHHIDCLAYAGPHLRTDPNHAVSYAPFATCVGNSIRSLGYPGPVV